MSKLPWFKFYPGDWLKDPNLSPCSASTRGIWIDLIIAMEETNPRGELTGNQRAFCQWGRCTPREWTRFLDENNVHNFAYVTKNHEKITVISRRIKRDEDSKEQARIRQQKHRGQGVTPNSQGGNVAVTGRCQKSEVRDKTYSDNFENWWGDYPRKIGKPTTAICFDRLTRQGVPEADLTRARDNYVDYLADNKTEERYIMHPSTFLGPHRRFEDYLVAKEEAVELVDGHGKPLIPLTDGSNVDQKEFDSLNFDKKLILTKKGWARKDG